jgi:hypothetical protein
MAPDFSPRLLFSPDFSPDEFCTTSTPGWADSLEVLVLVLDEEMGGGRMVDIVIDGRVVDEGGKPNPSPSPNPKPLVLCFLDGVQSRSALCNAGVAHPPMSSCLTDKYAGGVAFAPAVCSAAKLASAPLPLFLALPNDA